MNSIIINKINNAIIKRLDNKKADIQSYNSGQFNTFNSHYNATRKTTTILMQRTEAIVLHSLAKVSENILEIGTYKGGSAILMRLANPKAHITTIDTYKGLIENCKYDKKQRKGMYKSDYNTTKALLKNYNINTIKGDIQKIHIPNVKYDLINIDVDTYQSTINAINHIKNNRHNKTVVICHDYGQTKGVYKSIKDIGLKAIPINSTQCIIQFD